MRALTDTVCESVRLGVGYAGQEQPGGQSAVHDCYWRAQTQTLLSSGSQGMYCMYEP